MVPFPCARCCLILPFFIVFVLSSNRARAQDSNVPEVLQVSAEGRLGSNATLSCLIRPPDVSVQWTFNDKPVEIDNKTFTISLRNISQERDVDGNRRNWLQASLHITEALPDHHGRFGCIAQRGVDGPSQDAPVVLDLSLPTRPVEHSVSPNKVQLSTSTELSCTFMGFNLTEVKWRKDIDMRMKFPADTISSVKLNTTHIQGTLRLVDLNRKDNGTYLCGARDIFTTEMIKDQIHLFVLEPPQISIDYMKGVGAKKIYLNWTVNDGNAPIELYSLQLRKEGSETWTYHSSPVSPKASSFVVTDLEPSSSYQLKVNAKNSVGWAKPYADQRWVQTLEKDPEFVPDIVVKGFTMSSVTVGWSPPPEALAEYVHLYELAAREAGWPDSASKEAVHSGDYRNLPYMFENLTPHTTYIFKVRACSELTKECGAWSLPVNGTTMDGVSGPVTEASLLCQRDNISSVSFLHASWQPPLLPNGKIVRYDIEVFGNASFLNSDGMSESMSWGPKIQHPQATARVARFNNIPHNTNYTVRINAVTRSRKPGQQVTLVCTTPPAPPPRDSLAGFRWDKVREYDGRWLFRLYLPRVTERNGAICCYRVFVVRMKNDQRLSDMPSPEHLALSSYSDVHSGKQGAGAYIAEMFTSNTFHSEVILGDGAPQANLDSQSLRQCVRCAEMAAKWRPTTTAAPTTTSAMPTTAPPVTVTQPTTVQPITEVVTVQAEGNKTGDGVTGAPAGVTASANADEDTTDADGADEDSSTEKDEADKSRLLKKKKKIKRQFPTDGTIKESLPKKLALQGLQDYQNTQPLPEPNGLFRQSESSYNDDRKFTLDNEFFINRRIYLQNKPKMHSEESDRLKESQVADEWSDRGLKKDSNKKINNDPFKEESNNFDRNDYSRDDNKNDDSIDMDEDDVVWTNNDEEDIEDLVMVSKGDKRKTNRAAYSNEQEFIAPDVGYLGKHKIVSRDTRKNEDIVQGQYLERNLKYPSVRRVVRQTEDFGQLLAEHAQETEHMSHGSMENERLKKLQERQKELELRGEVIVQEFGETNGIPIEVRRIEKKDDITIETSGVFIDGVQVFDGQLDVDSNYTGFVELLVHSEGLQWAPIYSNYFSVLSPGPDQLPGSDKYLLEMLIKIIGGCVGVALLLVVILWAVYAHGRRKAPHNGVEMNTLQTTLRSLYAGLRGGGRHQLVSHAPPDMPPIARQDLLHAYTERQNDSGYGFQHEFELLPDCFPDRTMEASEAKENQGKNRYPDIKAYDQTRVRLTPIEGVLGSDYINANIVLGYKERKRFVCAQGPTDVTVDDFWRMIWEHNLELVVMLTNLEEYSKVKCAKYWPDQHHSHKLYAGCIHVQHQGEKRYSDYIIRELRISKQPLSNSSSQIIEANGVKKNGELNNGNGTASGTSEERVVRQYHFLMWKDFVAPEHPHAILKFIKRVNEACNGGRTALVHCSAGVGRTGTLVALDCLLEQLNAEGQVAVFNTVCDLRRQRNFLVQSLKQYVFVYRALLEFAQFGDTEIPASRLKPTVDRLRQTAENSDTCAMEDEFEKLRQPMLDVIRPCGAGRAPESVTKNRNEAVLPYDHNRVILAPVPTREHSTYINASFIEGYDNSESYIIAQDPLPSTIADFWRMVSEQEITTIVMLSELGEGKCPRYWDDEEVQHEHISVSYLHSESCPYYTRREFQITNTKNQERLRVTQLQYHGWPTVSGQVPEVTRGLIELVGQSGSSPPANPPMLVHCSLGTERSSMFVALSILITQLRTEQRVDVSTVTRKLRSQRMGCLDTFLQYEFLHRAIVNYAELHNLLTDS